MKHTLHKINLNSGAKLLAINVPNSPVFAIFAIFRAGYRFINPKLFELPHLMEHLAFEGNKTYPNPKKFMFEIEKDGAYQNAFTDRDTVSYLFIANSEEYKKITNLSLTQITEPLFKEKSISHEKEVVTNELSRNLSNDRYRLYYTNMQSIIPSFYPDWQKRINIVKKINRRDILNYYKKTHSSNNLFYLIAGDINNLKLKQIEGLLNSGTKKLPIGDRHNFVRPKFANFGRTMVVKKPHAKNQSYFSLSLILKGCDEASRPAMNILNAIFSRGFSSRIFQKARKAGLTYSLYSAYSINQDLSRLNIVDQTQPEKLMPLFELTIKELTDIAKGNFTKLELDRARGYIIGSYKRSFQTAYDFVNWYIYDYAVGKDLESPEKYLTKIQKVTRADIKKAADKYIRKDNWVLTLMGENLDKEKFRKILDKYL